jgi:rRNA maturation endonuclease Nob1
VKLKRDQYFYCPNCANKIDLSLSDINFCDVCGHKIDPELKSRGFLDE